MSVFMRSDEREVASKLIDDALAKGYVVTVYDGQEFPVSKSSDRAEILDGMAVAGQDNLWFYPTGNKALGRIFGKAIGRVFLVYGNEPGVLLSDWTDNAETNSLVAGALELAAEIAAKEA